MSDTSTEYFEVVRSLRKHHSLFAQFWTVGHIVEINHPGMPTAGVAFDKKSGAGLQFMINPDYWAKLNEHDKAFVIAHEIMHVYLDHGRRSLTLDPKLSNLAQDVVINHYLVDYFDFDRSKLTHGESYCWRDTMFPDRDDIEPDRCFEYYYEELKKQGGPPQPQQGEEGDGEPGQGQGQGGEPTPGDGQPQPGAGQPGAGQPKNQTVDVHDFMDGEVEMDADMLDAIQKAAEDLMDRITADEVENFEEIVSKGNGEESDKLEEQKAQQAGAMAGTMQKRIRLKKVVRKRKWENVVADVIGRFQGMKRDVDLQLWTRPNRRLAGMGDDLILPADVTDTVPIRDKVDVWFFQDTSGSCVDLAERFFKAAASIPDDRFRVRVFCFDTKVYETSLASGKLYGFGGTAFQPLEQAVQDIVRKEPGTKYPQAVFVVTDGEAWDGVMKCEHPDRWHWFLTYKNTKCIPKKSHNYLLKDYE